MVLWLDIWLSIGYIEFKPKKIAISGLSTMAIAKQFNNKIMPQNLKAISIHAPHAYAICMGIKQYEYRSQPTDRRGWILIHASLSKASDSWLADYGIEASTMKRGAIIGAAKIVGCTWDYEFECYAYHLESAILFDQAIEGIKGCQAIFWGANNPARLAAFATAWELISASDRILITPAPTNAKPHFDSIRLEAIETPGYCLEPESDSCECGDTHFRKAHCKHQIAAEDYMMQHSLKKAVAQVEGIPQWKQASLALAIDFISPDGFYNWEAIASGEVIATIAYDPDDWTQRYVVAVGEGEIHRCNTQSRAESYIRWHYAQGTLGEDCDMTPT